MATITQLQVIFQKPVDESEVPDIEDLLASKVFATQGQTEVYKYVRTATGIIVENHLELVPCTIPTGVGGATQVVRVAIMRLLKTMKTWDPEWVQYYVIARFEGTGREGKTEFFRTIVPRSEIPLSIRDLRRGNIRDRKHGAKPRRRVRR